MGRQLPYLEAITKETLRLHPTSPLAVRRSLEPCAVGGYDVVAGAMAFVNMWAIGRDPTSWAPDPLAFRPERFLKGGEGEGLDDWTCAGSTSSFCRSGPGGGCALACRWRCWWCRPR
jgi:cytochrome P450